MILIKDLKSRDVTALPPYKNLVMRFTNTEEVTKERGYNTSLWKEKIQIIRTKKFLGLPRGFFFGTAAPLNLVEANHRSPHDPILLTKQLHRMLGIGQISLKRCEIIDNDISGCL
jgi:hypothetical protein